jgi:hypothetical protein
MDEDELHPADALDVRVISRRFHGSAYAANNHRERAYKLGRVPSIWPGQRPFWAPHLFERPLPPTAPG